MKISKVKIGDIKVNPSNPRIIRDYKFDKLVKSIREFPKMLEIRPIVVNEDNIILGGNMRYKACIAAGLKEVNIIQVNDLTEEQQKEFLIKDNSGYGQWDWEVLANEWDHQQLVDWALDLPMPGTDDAEFFGTEEETEDEPYTKKIDAPEYEPQGEKPTYEDLFNEEKTKELIEKIGSANISKQDKRFLTKAAQRHIIFNYSKIAEFYCHADKEVQELMEDSALIIIDFKKAIQQGYVTLNEQITDQYLKDYGDDE